MYTLHKPSNPSLHKPLPSRLKLPLVFLHNKLAQLGFIIWNIIITFQIMLQQRNDKTQGEMIKLLKDFYQAALQGHNRNQQKKQVLNLFLKRVETSLKNNADASNIKAKVEYDSQATVPDAQGSQCNSTKPHLLASNMAFTNFLSNCTDKTDLATNGWQIKASKSFSSKYVHKILLYSFWINFFETKMAFFLSQLSQDLSFSHQIAKQCLKRLKQALEKALKWLKSVDRRKFSKNCYLYRQLLDYTAKHQPDYFRVVIEQMDNDYLARTFEHLWEQESELVYSRSIMQGSSFEVNFSGLVMLQEINKSLEHMNAHLIIVEPGSQVSLDANKSLNIVLEEHSSGMYTLKDIITFRSPSNGQL